MKTIKQLTYAFVALCLTFVGIGCDKEPVETPVNKPTIGILDPEFDSKTMTVNVMIAPSSDATAWYYKVEGGDAVANYTKVESAAAQEIEFKVTYGVEYTISAYAENKAGASDVATKRFCQMPDGEVTVTIGDMVLNEATMEVEATIYPSANVTKWYWRVYEKDSIKDEWIGGEGTTEQKVSFAYVWGVTYILEAYAECGAIKSAEVAKECYFEPSVPTITVSDASFDEATMTVTFEVKPSADTHHWYWGIKADTASPSDYEQFEGAEARSVSCIVEYDVNYTFLFRAENVINKGEDKEVIFSAWGKVADITIENLTAYCVDAKIEKNEKCVRYVVGAMHTEAYDRATFIEEAQTSLNPDPSYPFAIFNSATENRTFSEQDLVRNSLLDSNANAGLLLASGVSFTVAVYGEDENGNYNVSTTEFTVPKAELNGNHNIDIAVGDITETSATATVTADEGCKFLMGYIDPTIAASDSENPFDFEGKSDEEIKRYIISVVNNIPEVYTATVTRTLSNYLAIGSTYYAYAIAIKDGKIGDVAFEKFSTIKPSLSGVAKITSAEIVEQTSHETLTVLFTTDNNATKIRLYAAPSTDYAADQDNIAYILDADSFQNYREEYAVTDGAAMAKVDIYHPGDKYYLFASAVDKSGKAGEMVCVARMSGFDTDYYTAIEEIIEEVNIDLTGTGTVDMVVTVSNVVDDRISVTVNTDSRSANAEKVWLIRFNGKINDIEAEVKQAFSEYADTKKIIGSYKEAKVGYPLKYEDGGSSWDPKYEALQEYDATWGGDILVAVVLDTDGKLRIHSYYAAGGQVVVM